MTHQSEIVHDNVFSRASKSTSQLKAGDFIVEPGINILLKVLGPTKSKKIELKRLEGPLAGSITEIGYSFGRTWHVVTAEEAEHRLLAALTSLQDKRRSRGQTSAA